MKTESYNPSQLEVELTNQLTKLKKELENGFSTNSIFQITSSLDQDNPTVIINTLDDDGDPHEIVLKIIQRPDTF
jgi:hypothetical protein